MNFKKRTFYFSIFIVHFFAFLFLGLKGSLTALVLKETKFSFSVVVDGGSTGTRCHLFKFDKHKRLAPLNKKKLTIFKSVEIGLASLKNEPEKVSEVLKGLLMKILRFIPKEARPVPFYFGGTGGLRLLEDGEAQTILKVIEETLTRDFSGVFTVKSVEILEGVKEGLFLYRGAAYAGRSLTEGGRIAVVDIGGASLQLSHYAEGPEEGDGVFKIGENDFAFSHSWLNFGLKAFRFNFLKAAPFSPCVSKGQTVSVSFGHSDEQNVQGTGNFEKCKEEMGKTFETCENCLLERVPIKFPPTELTFFVNSFAKNISKRLGLLKESEDTLVTTAEEIEGKVDKTCKQILAKDSLNPPFPTDFEFLCLDGVFLNFLLQKGLKIPKRQKVTITDKLKYRYDAKHAFVFEAAWPLGVALLAVT